MQRTSSFELHTVCLKDTLFRRNAMVDKTLDILNTETVDHHGKILAVTNSYTEASGFKDSIAPYFRGSSLTVYAKNVPGPLNNQDSMMKHDVWALPKQMVSAGMRFPGRGTILMYAPFHFGLNTSALRRYPVLSENDIRMIFQLRYRFEEHTHFVLIDLLTAPFVRASDPDEHELFMRSIEIKTTVPVPPVETA